MIRLTLDQFNQLYLGCLEESERIEHTEIIIARCHHSDLGQIILIIDSKEGLVIIHQDYDSNLRRSPVLSAAI